MDSFQPNWVSAPGETIVDLLDERELSIDEFAASMGYSVGKAQALLDGSAEITPTIAGRLTKVVGATQEFWLTRESQYRHDMSRLRERADETPNKAWLNQLPLADMKQQGWIESSLASGGDFQACLEFFDVPNVTTWHERYDRVVKMAAFRTSSAFKTEIGPVAAWLRRGELLAENISCNNWDAKKFKDGLKEIRKLTRKHDPAIFIPALKELCAKCGVAVVVLRAPNGCRASGATKFISSTKALLLLSFRYRSDDHFWFTFFHEAAHLLLHGKTAIFLEDGEMVSTHQEDEANDFATKYLIPASFEQELLSLRALKREVIDFAFRVGISPGIVVGQLQHRKRLKQNQLNFLKRRYAWK